MNIRDDIAESLVNYFLYSMTHTVESVSLPRLFLNEVVAGLREVLQKTGTKCYFLNDFGIDALQGLPEVKCIRSVEGQPIQGQTVILAFQQHFALVEAMRAVKNMGGHFVNLPKTYPPARYFHLHKLAHDTMVEEAQKNIHIFDSPDFDNIFQAIDITRTIHGCYVEIGVYKGGSASAALNYMKKRNIQRDVYLLDTFEGFKYPEALASADIGFANTHTDTSVEFIKKLLVGYQNVSIIKSNIMTDNHIDQINNIALCNIDVDMYEAVLVALNRVAPKIAINGVIICEDQGHFPSVAGAYLALLDFLDSETGKKFQSVHLTSGQALLFRRS